MSEPRLSVRDAPVGAALGALVPAVTADLAPFFDGFAGGRLMLRRCDGCGRPRYPAGPICPHCGDPSSTWSAVSGRGSVHSWVRYRRSFLAEFEALVPYVVLCVELDDGGVHLFGRLAGEGGEPAIGTRVQAVVERWGDGTAMLAFVPDEGGG